jgi:erythromycin esterase-like protein
MVTRKNMADAHENLINEIRNHSIALTGKPTDYTPLLDMIGDARFILIGEATHGTEEFYRMRAELTKKLIKYYDFDAVAVEADWPDSYRVNRYVQGSSHINNVYNALGDFIRFPTWMWRNEAMVEFIDWLRNYNDVRSPNEKVGFYGLDIYSLNSSIKTVIDYLDKTDPDAAKRARTYYGCFNHHYAENPQDYGYYTITGMKRTCEQEVIQQLIELRNNSMNYLRKDGFVAAEAFFCAEQNAQVVKNAEEYYRAMFQDHVSSWNLRDHHMMETLSALENHLSKMRGEKSKIVVWAHNSHIGSAQATEMGVRGEWNIGQLAKERYGKEAVSIGFSTYNGTVTAASQWGGEAEYKIVRPALKESYEALFHEVGIPNFALLLRDNLKLAEHLNINRLQRAIGVLYLPETERHSHYFYSRLPEQFDAIIHIDKTTALKPLERSGLWQNDEVFETYPTGM